MSDNQARELMRKIAAVFGSSGSYLPEVMSLIAEHDALLVAGVLEALVTRMRESIYRRNVGDGKFAEGYDTALADLRQEAKNLTLRPK